MRNKITYTFFLLILLSYSSLCALDKKDPNAIDFTSANERIKLVISFDSEGYQKLLATKPHFVSSNNVNFNVDFGNYFSPEEQNATLAFEAKENVCDLYFYQKKDKTWFEFFNILNVPCRSTVDIEKSALSLNGLFLDSNIFSHGSGSTTLFLFNNDKHSIELIEGFDKLGLIEEFEKQKNIFYGYHSAGCADACWESMLFKIVNYKIKILFTMECYDNKLQVLSESKEVMESSSCDQFNKNDKFEQIKLKWLSIINVKALTRPLTMTGR
jgi:hypothetical protein